MNARDEIVFGDGFWKDVSRLPKEAQKKLGRLFEILATDAFDARLHSKPLGPPLVGRYAFRITRDWRVAFVFQEPHTIKLLAVGRRDKIYQRLQRKI